MDPAEERFRASHPGNSIVRLVADDRGRYIDANEDAERVLGYTRDELLAMSVWDLTPAAAELDGLQLWQEFIHQGQQQGEYVVKRKSGALLKLHYSARANVEPGRHLALMAFIPIDE